MLKKIIIALFISFIFQSGFAQKNKIVYINTDSIVITKEEFKAANSFKFIKKEITTDSLLIKKLEPRCAYGFLDDENKKLLFSILAKITNETTDRSSKILIHNYNYDKKSLKKAQKNTHYWSYLKRNSKKYTSFLLTSDSSKEKKSKRIFLDNNKYIQKLFFTNSEFNVNHVVIKQNGEFTIYYGDLDILNILDSEA